MYVHVDTRFHIYGSIYRDIRIYLRGRELQYLTAFILFMYIEKYVILT